MNRAGSWCACFGAAVFFVIVELLQLLERGVILN